MTDKLILGSLTRIAPFAERTPGIEPQPRSTWKTGDYVVIEMGDSVRAQKVELRDGRIAAAGAGRRIVGALGERAATLESVGSWRAVGDDLSVNMMTAAGLIGRFTSRSALMPAANPARYLGHATLDGVPVSMTDFVAEPSGASFDIPIVLIIGTSMSAGKTLAGRVIVRELKKRGLHVVGTKLTGAGRYRDVLSWRDAGADAVFDFVEGGLPSTVVDEDEYRRALGVVLDRIAAEKPDVVVAEAGASPLEPYNGTVVMEELADVIAFILLAASDPYAVTGVINAFDLPPDAVSGVATSTSAGIELIEKLTGVPAVNVLDLGDHERLGSLMDAKLGL
ncbi:MAG: hypothetical protein HKN94_06530 [Acidimicrobiales bacterium]|nr:hypothetical protein [Acidimicrobiales bacterium]